MKKLRKFLNVSVMVMTVLSMCGLGMLTPNFANAAASAGDLIKMEGNSSVYYFDGEKRFVFPNEATYFSWYSDFSGVVTIAASELQSYLLGGNVTMRPGTKLVKITTDPSVYAVEANGVLRKIQNEAQAASLYGSNWAKRVVDVPDAFFTNYSIGSALSSGSIPAGSLVKNAGSNDVYYFDGTDYRSIASEAAMKANRLSFDNVLTVTNTLTASGDAITGMEEALVKTSQGATQGQIVTGSGLMVSLNSMTPAAASVPKNGTSIPMAKVNLTAANDGAVTVNSMTVTRIGLSTSDDIDRVWMEQSGNIVASKKSVNSNNEAVLVFSPALVVPAGQTVAVELYASFKAATGNVGFSIASASAVSATAASISGSFPINGNLMSPTEYTVAEVYIDNGDSSKTVNIGDEDIRLGKFDINFATGTKDIIIKNLSLKNTGLEDLANVVSNVYLENNGDNVATGVINGKYINFTLTNSGYLMAKDDGDQTFYIKGDVIGKEVAGTSGIKLELNKDTDMNGVEAANGFGIKINSSLAGTFTTVSVSQLVINAGNVSVAKKSTSPSSSTVIKSSKAVVALLANIKADEAVVADGLRLNVLQTDSASFENVKVYLNGALVDSFDPTTVAATTLDTTVYLKKGDNEIKITVDVKSNAANDAKFQVSLNQASSLLDGAEYDLSGNAVSDSEITGTATGAIITVGGAALSAVKSDGYATTKNVVQGSTNVSLGKFTVKATNDAIKITQIKVASTTDNTSLSKDVYDVKIFTDGTQTGTTRNLTSTGATFSSLNILVADNTTKMIELFASFDTAADTASTTRLAIEFTAEDSNGKTVTVTDKPLTSTFAVVSTGTLNIAKDGDSIIGGILASRAGVEQEVATYKFTATNDSANVTELVIVNAIESATATTTLQTTDPRISAYKLYVEGNSTAIDTVTPFQGSAKFVLNNNQIVVPVDGSKKVTVKAVLNNIENDATATDAYLKLQINSVKYKSSNGDETPKTNLAVQGNAFRIRKTVPTVALATLPNTTLTSGDQVISKFTITADANADVKVAKIAVKYTATTNTSLATTSAPVKVNGVSKTLTASADTAAGYYTVDFGTSTPEIISAGTSKTFEIISNLTVGGTNTRESLSTSIQESTYDIIDATEYASDNNPLVWTDSASNLDSSNKWFNSYRVNGLPTNTQTMTTN